jgi:hypothetical protein
VIAAGSSGASLLVGLLFGAAGFVVCGGAPTGLMFWPASR